jgi:8-oxo-dGTP pyrophosphatase MutT (NUDIX family)
VTIGDPLAGLRARFAGRLEGSRVGGDKEDLAGPWKPAAVLVPIVTRPAGPTVLLTERARHLPDHPGQVSFPGGRSEPDDASPEATALREASEEIGLDAGLVEVIGRLDRYRTVSLYEVTPVLGFVSPTAALTPDALEVADVFEVPLAFLLDRANHQRRYRDTADGRRHYWAMGWRERLIWGATAGMLVNLVDLLDQGDSG